MIVSNAWTAAVSVAMAAILVLGSSTAAAQESPPAADELAALVAEMVPEAWDYARLTPEQRYDLRERSRDLPEAERVAVSRAVVAEVAKLPRWMYEVMSLERAAMDCAHGVGVGVGPLPRPPVLAAWDHVKLVPHQRYHFRMRARALEPAEREAYDAHLAAELATLPEWLQQALADEAVRYDARYGPTMCRD